MKSLQHSIRSKRTIVQATRKCVDNFATCTVLSEGSSREALSQLRSRFDLWVQYSGALAAESYSLDRRLLQDTDVAFSISSLLEGLAAILFQGTDTTPASDAYESSGKIEDRWQEESGDAWYHVDATIDTLLDLTHDIRKASKPKPVTHLSEPTERVGEGEYNIENFTILVRQLFPKSSIACQDHLARKIVEQQNAIFQNQTRMRALSESCTATSETKGLMLPPAAIPPSIFSRTRYYSGDRAETATPSIISSIESLAPEGSLTIGPQYPKLPIQAPGAKEFLCDFCGRRLRFSDLNETTWIAHIKKDLLPYICLFPRCHDPKQRFVHREEWTRHMRKWHGDDWTIHAFTSYWTCNADHCARKIFHDSESFKAHMQASHGYSGPNDGDARCWKESSRGPMQCPVCESVPGEIPHGLDLPAGRVFLWKHIGEHLKRLALYSLPSRDQEDEQHANVDQSSDDFAYFEASSDSKQTDRDRDCRQSMASGSMIAEIQDDRQIGAKDHVISQERLLSRDGIERVKIPIDRETALEQHEAVLPMTTSRNEEDTISVTNRQAAEEKRKWDAEMQEMKRKSTETDAARKTAELEEKQRWDAEMTTLKMKVAELVAAKKRVLSEAETSTSDDDLKKAPIKFKDAVGRKFSFPWHICKTWKGMETLINQAFLHVDGIAQHVHDGHYDLIGPTGEIILPQLWEIVVKPDWAISMHMWPMPEAPKEIPNPAPLDSSLSPSEMASYSSIIDRILASSDLQTISSRQIRNQMQQLIAHDLAPQKSAIKELIMQRFDKAFASDSPPQPVPEMKDAKRSNESLMRPVAQAPSASRQMSLPEVTTNRSGSGDIVGKRRAGAEIRGPNTHSKSKTPHSSACNGVIENDNQLDGSFICTHEGCGKYHHPSMIYHCDFPDCERIFANQYAFARHKEGHIAKEPEPANTPNSRSISIPVQAIARPAESVDMPRDIVQRDTDNESILLWSSQDHGECENDSPPLHDDDKQFFDQMVESWAGEGRTHPTGLNRQAEMSPEALTESEQNHLVDDLFVDSTPKGLANKFISHPETDQEKLFVNYRARTFPRQDPEARLIGNTVIEDNTTIELRKIPPLPLGEFP